MVCDTIKKLRENAGMSQSELARRLGVTRSSVNAWELSLSVPTTQYIVAISQIFHVSTDFLLGLSNKEALYIDDFSVLEKKILYDLISYFEQK